MESRKKTTLLGLATMMVLTMIICSCGKADIGEGEPVETDSIAVDTIAGVQGVHGVQGIQDDTSQKGQGNPKCHVHIEFKTPSNLPKGEAMFSLLSSILPLNVETAYLPKTNSTERVLHIFLKQYVEDYQRDGRLILDQEPNNEGLNWVYRVSTDVRRYREGVLAYIAKVHTFEGGLYPIDQTVVRNISEKDGRILSISDILIPGYDKTLLEDVVEQLTEDFQVDDIEGLRSKGLFIGIEPYLPDNFILGDGAIQFIYQADEIASHTLGEIKVTVRIGDSELSIKH